jgi:hypothetical protein
MKGLFLDRPPRICTRRRYRRRDGMRECGLLCTGSACTALSCFGPPMEMCVDPNC